MGAASEPGARVTHWAARFPLTTFFVLACGLTWALLPFAGASVLVSLIALLGPAAAALITAGLAGGERLRDLRARARLWRVPIYWYVVALLLPLPISALRSAVEYIWGGSGPVGLQPISVLELIVFVLVAGEEIGWRGFALPHLLSRYGPWTASAIVGLLWAFWHLPLFYMPGMPHHGAPFAAYVPYVVALSVILTMLAQRTGGSLVIATLFHGAVNTFGIVNASADVDQRGWGNALCYGVAALAIGVIAWRRRGAAAA